MEPATGHAGQISALPETVLSWIGGQIERRTGDHAAVAVAGIIAPRTPGQISTGSINRTVRDAHAGGQTMLSKLRGKDS